MFFFSKEEIHRLNWKIFFFLGRIHWHSIYKIDLSDFLCRTERFDCVFCVAAMLSTCSLGWCSFDCRTDWISLTSRDKVYLSSSEYLSVYLQYTATQHLSPCLTLQTSCCRPARSPQLAVRRWWFLSVWVKTQSRTPVLQKPLPTRAAHSSC